MRDDTGPSLGARLWSGFKSLVVMTLLLASAGAALWALSNLNARTYALEQRDGKLYVLKGKLMPRGFDPYVPADPGLADAYAPIDLKGNDRADVTAVTYADRDSLDRAIFSVLELLAKPRVISDLPKDLDEGLAYVRRAEGLSGLSNEQRESLKHLQAEVAFFLARTRLEDAQRRIEEAVAQLKVASQSQNRHTREASQMLLAVEPDAKRLSDTLRSAVHNLSQPAAPVVQPPVPAPQPAPVPAPAPAAPPAPEGTPAPPSPAP